MTAALARADRVETVRYQSEASIAAAVDRAGFDLEALIEAGPYGMDRDDGPIRDARHTIETLAAGICAERPAAARRLRIAAGDLGRAIEADGPQERYRALCSAAEHLDALS